MNIAYDVIVWCDFMEDLNKVVEQIIYFQWTFGQRYKFQIKGESYSFDTTNGVGEERIVRSNVTLTQSIFSSRTDWIEDKYTKSIWYIKDSLENNSKNLIFTKKLSYLYT